MRYFTPELWLASQGDFRPNGPTDRRWKRNCARYRRQLKQVLPRLSGPGAAFFKRHSLHDGTVSRISVGDGAIGGRRSGLFPGGRQRTTVVLEVLCFSGKRRRLYELRYSGVTKFGLRTEVTLFDGPGDSILGTWGCDELVGAGREHLRHDVLFSSGMELSIVFRRFSFRSRRLAPR